MRSTRASAAIARLNTRSGRDAYSMVRTASDLFYLTEIGADGSVETRSEPLELDEFVAFVNAYGPQVVKRVSKLDVAFEKQLQAKKP
jgi:hypothetical protein